LALADIRLEHQSSQNWRAAAHPSEYSPAPQMTIAKAVTVHTGEEILRDGEWTGDWTADELPSGDRMISTNSPPGQPSEPVGCEWQALRPGKHDLLDLQRARSVPGG